MSTTGSVVELKRKDRRLTLSDWFRKRKESLRDKCARYGLSITGKKAVLAERIYLYLHGEMATSETQEPEENLADTPLLDLPSEGFSLLTPVISTAQSESQRDNRSHTAPSKLAELSCAPVPPHESDPPQSTSCLQPTVFASPPQATSTSTTPFQFPLDQLRQLIREEFHQQQQVNQIRGTTHKGYSLTFCPKIGIYKKGLFLEKSKGYSLTFRPKIGIYKKGLFLKKAKGIALLFDQKSVFPKRAYFGKKQRV
eukprot:Seg2363.1 transcript_id=Seg2363.1/GoldUCD/mRNA.D3Y31 product="hypothetical protein" protein_id=Seg2363.1/GoldUCD/D3Y31